MVIAVIGTGIIGTKIAERLLNNHYTVYVYNRTIEKMNELKIKGAAVGTNVNSIISKADCLILTLSDKKTIDEVLCQNQFNFKNKIILQMGTISPAESVDLHKFINAAGGKYLECPILGSRMEIEQKKLIIMVGGLRAHYNKLQPFLSQFGSDHYYVGKVGRAAALKLALNHLIASHVAGFSLSLGIVEKNKIDPKIFMSILNKSSLFAPMFDKKLKNWTARNYSNPNFPTKHLLKDVRLIAEHAESIGLNTMVVRAIESLIQESVDRGLADLDYSSIFNTINRI